MLHFSLRSEVAKAIQKFAGFEGADLSVKNSVDKIPEKDKAIDELEAQFQEKYIRYCDPSIPLHLIAIYMSKSVICTMRLMAHHPRQYPDKGASMPRSEKDMLFSESLKMLEYDNIGHTEKRVEGFVWHLQNHFQLDAFIYILSELRYRTVGGSVERAWQQVKLSYDNRPEMLTQRKGSLYFAVGNLALKAWQKREVQFLANGMHQPAPRFISILRSYRTVIEQTQLPTEVRGEESYLRSTRQDYTNDMVEKDQYYQDTTGQWVNIDFGFDPIMPEIGPADWEYWQTLLDGELPAYSGVMDTAQHWAP